MGTEGPQCLLEINVMLLMPSVSLNWLNFGDTLVETPLPYLCSQFQTR